MHVHVFHFPVRVPSFRRCVQTHVLLSVSSMLPVPPGVHSLSSLGALLCIHMSTYAGTYFRIASSVCSCIGCFSNNSSCQVHAFEPAKRKRRKVKEMYVASSPDIKQIFAPDFALDRSRELDVVEFRAHAPVMVGRNQGFKNISLSSGHRVCVGPLLCC